jgi:hypothetical protein
MPQNLDELMSIFQKQGLVFGLIAVSLFGIVYSNIEMQRAIEREKDAINRCESEKLLLQQKCDSTYTAFLTSELNRLRNVEIESNRVQRIAKATLKKYRK